MKKFLKGSLIFIFILATFGIFTLLFLVYGPNSKFRDWLINTAMGTKSHKYLATIFYDDKTIDDSLNKNKIFEFSFDSNLDEIEFIDYSNIDNFEFKDKYEEQVLVKDENNNDYKIIRIEEEKFDGYLAVIYDPSRIHVAVTKHFGKDGQYLETISEQNNALVAITGGGFIDPTGKGTGGEPLGITISNGELIHETLYNGEIINGGLVGITSDNKLYLGTASGKEALEMGIRDSVSFGPFLIVNGISAKIEGDLAGGRSPRTAIAQRKDGIFLFLVLDGDRTLGRGATYKDIIDVMEKYGAYNATCLDGGSSAGMTVNHKLINNPTTKSGKHMTRPIATAFIYK